MKKILLSTLLSLFIVFGLSGCYTIIWSPDTEFPNEENSDNSSIYYDNTYYGSYYDWYDVPWWYDYAPPIPTQTTTGIRVDNSDTGRLRDTGNGRGASGRIIDVQPPSKNENPSGDNNKGSSTDSGNSNSSDRSSSSNSGNSSGNSNSSSSSSTRNNDGGRSSGGRR